MSGNLERRPGENERWHFGMHPLPLGRAYGNDPPVGGLFNFKLSSWPHPWEFGQNYFRCEGGCSRGKEVACFWATSLEKILGGVIAIISFRPRGWMQQSAVPRCAILSVGSTGGIRQ